MIIAETGQKGFAFLITFGRQIFSCLTQKQIIMKKLYALFAPLTFAIVSPATIHTVSVSDFAFTPSSVTAVCGDTIAWVWQSGSHTTTSTTIPGCATAWNSPINSSMLAYAIVIPCAGTYNYKCNFHANMTGTITATCTGGINDPKLNVSSQLFPNPFTGKVTIKYHNADEVRFTNVVGEAIKTVKLDKSQSQAEIDLADLPSGVYFYSALKEGMYAETRKIIKQ